MSISSDGVYVDLTFGGGGHSAEILKSLADGHLYSFDQDADAKSNTEGFDPDKFTFIAANFRYMKQYLKMYRVGEVDSILADLGVSSHQIDAAERGFSTRFNAVLDMRMDQNIEKTAKLIINEYSAEELQRVFGMYGEVRNARTVAQAIVSARVARPIKEIDELKEVLKNHAPRGRENKYFAQIFQALRIEVNDEMKALEEMLQQGADVLKPGGLFVVMSYHSLEDRLVKNFFGKGNFTGKVEQDFYGNVVRPLEPVTRKPVTASQTELARNPRARSAKLRVARKN